MAQHIRIPIKFDPTIVMYLIILEKYVSKYASLLEVQPSERFFDMVRREVMNCMRRGKEPPKAIAGAIMNIADDMASGRDVTIRAGDYISLVTYARSQKML
jgi:hypothetical protein